LEKYPDTCAIIEVHGLHNMACIEARAGRSVHIDAIFKPEDLAILDRKIPLVVSINAIRRRRALVGRVRDRIATEIDGDIASGYSYRVSGARGVA
jgi:hypothetical protein